jgi:hypothetical protein
MPPHPQIALKKELQDSLKYLYFLSFLYDGALIHSVQVTCLIPKNGLLLFWTSGISFLTLFRRSVMNGLIAVRISRPLSQEELLVSVIFGGNVFIPTDSTTQRQLREEMKRAYLLLGPIDLEIIQALLGSDDAQVSVLSRKYRQTSESS